MHAAAWVRVSVPVKVHWCTGPASTPLALVSCAPVFFWVQLIVFRVKCLNSFPFPSEYIRSYLPSGYQGITFRILKSQRLHATAQTVRSPRLGPPLPGANVTALHPVTVRPRPQAHSVATALVS